MNLSQMLWGSLNTDLKGGIFGAFIILTVLCGIFLVSKTFLWIFFFISLIVAGVTGYMIFFKDKKKSSV